MLGLENGEVSLVTHLNTLVYKGSVRINRSVRLGDYLLFLFFCAKENRGTFKLHASVLYLAVGSFNEAHGVDLGIDAKRRNQTDVWSFRRFNRAKASVVGVVYVTHLKSGTLTAKTARPEGRQATLVRDLGQWIRLIHELAELIGSKEGINYRTQRLCIDQVNRREDFVVAHVHALADCSGHSGKTDSKLIGHLLAHGAHTAVRKVVNVVNLRLRIAQLDEVLYDGDNIILRKNLIGRIGLNSELLVQAVATNLSEAVALLAKEQLVDDAAGGVFVGRFGVAKLAVDVLHGFNLRIGRILLKRVVNDGEFSFGNVFFVKQNSRNIALDDEFNVLLL